QLNATVSRSVLPIPVPASRLVRNCSSLCRRVRMPPASVSIFRAPSCAPSAAICVTILLIPAAALFSNSPPHRNRLKNPHRPRPSLMKPIRLLLLDDHVLFREGLSRLLESEPDFKMVAQCGTPSEALAVLAKSEIDIVLLDYDLEDDTGTRF